jgi:diguanylate cyclase (GGDEF)-like protein
VDLSFRQAGVVLATLVALVLTYPVSPEGLARDGWYAALGSGSVLWAYLGLRQHRPGRPEPWVRVLLGFGAWALGDLAGVVEDRLLHTTFYPLPSDVLSLAGYLLIGAGFLAMGRGVRSRGDLTALLDAAIIATGAGVMTAVFLVDPITQDSSLNLAGKLVSSAYPLLDVLLIGLLVRQWAMPGARTVSVELLTAAVGVKALADMLWNVASVTTGATTPWVGVDMLWLGGYVVLAIAAWVPSMRDASEPLPEHEPRVPGAVRLVVLAGGLVLPAVTLLVDGFTGGPQSWAVTGVASIALTLLVLARMAGLLATVSEQAVQLAALARADSLTGAPNRRTWDHELTRVCQSARATGTPLCVAMVDLDHFKRYNDAHGHQAGDELLREAVGAWSALLAGGEFLARYGGEEFALLLPGLSPIDARLRLDALRTATPHDQTFSAGIALWDPETEPGTAVAAADEALYRAKRAGRNRVVLADSRADEDLPKPTIVLQPIVDITTGEIVAEEALSRFGALDTLTAFESAHRLGRGHELEIMALRAALKLKRPDRMLALNITLDTLVTARAHELLPADLHGIILEITEHGDVDHLPGTDELLQALRLRGCAIAIDDWGKGHSNLDRMLRLRPEIIKLDLSLVQGHEALYHRAVIRAITSWAEEVGALVCAEGIEDAYQRSELAALGVHLGQGYLFGRPEVPRIDAATRSVGALVSQYVNGAIAPPAPPLPATRSKHQRVADPVPDGEAESVG